MKKIRQIIILFFVVLTFFSCSQKKTSVITIDVAKNGVEVPKDLWGIFYEEINRAGDGGLWPEMIYNMGFEEKNIPSTCSIENNTIIPPAEPNYAFGRVSGYKFHHFDPENKTEGWGLENHGNSKSSMKVVEDKPLNKANPHSLQVDIEINDNGVNLINAGYKGIYFVNGGKYNLGFYLRADNSYKGNVIISIVDNTGKAVFSEEYNVDNSGEWIKYKSEIISNVTDSSLKLFIQFNSTGKVWVDYVSLLPEDTFKGHGLRKDIAQTLADLKPSFIRWPGGCIVEGMTMENRVKWKHTIGERLSRKGEFDLWGYHNTYSFGYHDFLQFCEDVGASGMYVVNAGLSCMVRNGDYYEMNQMDVIIEDILDAIEYAIGDVKSKWGAERAKNGHPDPFPLKYVEIGNENMGALYGERYNLIYDACKAKYPNLKYIHNSSLSETMPDFYDIKKIEMIDPHYYVTPETFFNTVHLFDDAKRGNFEVYIGEYAVNSNVGSGTLEGALAEAAFMFGIEHNSDLVKIASYAPLLENVNFSNWPTNLIRFNNNTVFGRSSYHVQKLFNENKPDVTLDANLDLVKSIENISGKIGFSSSIYSEEAKISVKNFTVKEGEVEKYSSNFPSDTTKWEIKGSWKVEDSAFVTGELKDLSYLDSPGLYIAGNPKDGGGRVRLRSGGSLVLKNLQLNDYTISADVMRDKVFQGFSIRFGITDDNNYYTLTVKDPNMRRFWLGGRKPDNKPSKYVASVEHVVNGTSLALGNIGDSFDFGIDDWHNVIVSVKGNRVSCSIDGANIGELKCESLQKQHVVAGYDKKNEEIIIKVVNGKDEPFSTQINLSNTVSVEPVGKIIVLSSESSKDDNDFENINKVSPVESEYNGFSNSFNIEFKPNSFTILRTKIAR